MLHPPDEAQSGLGSVPVNGRDTPRFIWLMRVSARQLPVRRCLVDGSGDVFGQLFRNLVDGYAEFVGQLLQVDPTNSLVDLLRGDRKIGAGGHPTT